MSYNIDTELALWSTRVILSSQSWLGLITEVYCEVTSKGTRPPTVDCPSIQSGVSGVFALEVTSQYTSVIKPNQDCEKRITRVNHKANSESINLSRESLLKMITL
jgi:hypothetical protein